MTDLLGAVIGRFDFLFLAVEFTLLFLRVSVIVLNDIIQRFFQLCEGVDQMDSIDDAGDQKHRQRQREDRDPDKALSDLFHHNVLSRL